MKSPQFVRSLLIVVLVIGLQGCSKVLASTNTDPQYLHNEIKAHPPRKESLTPYLANHPPDAIWSLEMVGNRLFAASVRGLYFTDNAGESWLETKIKSKAHKNDSLYFFVPNEASVDSLPVLSMAVKREEDVDVIFAGTSNGVYRSADNGVQWSQLSGEIDDLAIWSLTVVEGNLFAGTHSGIFRYNEGSKDWVAAGQSLTDQYVRTLNSVGRRLVAGTANGLFWSENFGQSWHTASDELTPEQTTSVFANDKDLLVGTLDSKIYRIRKFRNDATVEKLNGNLLRGSVLSIWVDPADPEFIVAGTTDGLFWTRDGGNRFYGWTADPEGSLNAVTSVIHDGGQLWIAGTRGVYYVVDLVPRSPKEPRPSLSAAIKKQFHDNRGLVFTILSSFLVIVFFSTRAILLLLQLDISPIKEIAPWFYQSPLGRWKLFRRYKRQMEANPEIRSEANRYVEIPYTWNGAETSVPLSDQIRSFLGRGRIAISGEGGRGKSALCSYLRYIALDGSLRSGNKELVPVILDGPSYAGSILDLLISNLSAGGCYVNTAIVQFQLAAGNLLIIFDGFSEIRQSFRQSADLSDIPRFIQQYPDQPFIISSRGAFPSAIERSLGRYSTVALQDLDSTTEPVFLSQYLKRGPKETEDVISQMNVRLATLPRIPLMLRLVATVYDKTGQVPKDRAALFGEYVAQLLRSDVTGIDEPAGLDFAIRHLVRQTFLRSGGDRGMTLDQAVKALAEIKAELANYDIAVSPIALLNVLCRSGLLKRIRERLMFFHDSFESYFAARCVAADLHSEDQELLRALQTNDRFVECRSFLDDIVRDTEDEAKLGALDS